MKTIFLRPVTPLELHRLVSSCCASHSSGVDGVPGDLLRQCYAYLEKPLLYLLNRSFSGGIFPDKLKLSKVIPIFKNKGSKFDPNNYRPISLQNQFARIFEKAFYTRITGFFHETECLSQYQHGFMQGRSTETAFITAIDFISRSLDEGGRAAALLYDFSRAFDMVDHGILLDKLARLGVRGLAHSWLGSYLRNRGQVVQLEGGVRSSQEFISCGVPQGSVLGPILFLVIINDLPNCFPESTVPVLYADDTNCLLSSSNLNEAILMAQSTTNAVSNWANNNKLIINSSKSALIHFLPKNGVRDLSWCIYLDGNTVQQHNSVKFLGLTIDHKLTWEEQCSKVANTLYSFSYLFRTLRNIVSHNTLMLLYYGHVYSRLTYGIVCWGLSSHAYNVFVAQKCILRQIAGIPRSHSARPLFSQFQILTLPCIYILHASLHARKIIHNLDRNCDIHSYNTRNCGKLYIPYCRTTVCANGPHTSSIKIYNQLPTSIKETGSLNLFKKSLKSYLLSKQFYSVQEFLV